MNLIHDPWIPIIRKDGQTDLICPWQITDKIESNPIVGLDYQRADFNGSMAQFLIGLFQTVFIPRDSKDWQRHWNEPPSIEILMQAMNFFNL